jgi:four helix bundle protein
VYAYTDLNVYRISMDLVMDIYKATADFPKDEVYGLISQMRRCSVSIPSNIAEGSGRHSTKEFIQFLFTANASLSELETQVEISRRLGYIPDTAMLVESIKRIRTMLLNLIKSLKNKLTEIN